MDRDINVPDHAALQKTKVKGHSSAQPGWTTTVREREDMTERRVAAEKKAPHKISEEERRRRRQLARVRQVRKRKRILFLGAIGIFLIVGAIFLRSRKRETKEAFQREPAEVKTAETERTVSPTYVSENEYIEKIRNLASTDERYQKVLDHVDEYPENVLRLCVQNEEALDFVVDYPERKNDAPSSTVGKVTQGVVPLLIQWDSRWGYAPYGDETIVAVSGCGPTCIAMVAAGLTGRSDITPADVAAYSATNGFLTATRDTSWDLMTYGGQEYGITGTELGLDENVMANTLAAGYPIIASVGPGDFTQGGHFIVLTGYDGNAFTVNDPNSVKRSEQTWTFDRLKGQILNMWYYMLTE